MLVEKRETELYFLLRYRPYLNCVLILLLLLPPRPTHFLSIFISITYIISFVVIHKNRTFESPTQLPNCQSKYYCSRHTRHPIDQPQCKIIRQSKTDQSVNKLESLHLSKYLFCLFRVGNFQIWLFTIYERDLRCSWMHPVGLSSVNRAIVSARLNPSARDDRKNRMRDTCQPKTLDLAQSRGLPLLKSNCRA